MKEKKSNLTIIVGCGRLGSRIANEIYNEDANVIVIDRHSESFSNLDSSFGGMTITGDGCDFEILEKADIAKADCVIAVTEYDNNNIFIGEAAKLVYGVNKVIVRIINEDLKEVIKGKGIATVCPAEISTKAVLNYCNGGINE